MFYQVQVSVIALYNIYLFLHLLIPNISHSHYNFPSRQASGQLVIHAELHTNIEPDRSISSHRTPWYETHAKQATLHAEVGPGGI